jgi:hypothetical protein
MNKYRQHVFAVPGLRWLAAALAVTVIVACGGGGGGEEEDPTTPTITASGATRAVVRKGDTTPLPAAFAVTVTDPGTGTVAWSSPSVASLGSGNSLALPATATALAAGEHTLTARITNPRNGRSAQTTFSLLVLADGTNTDDDNDGLTYDQEKAAGTQPGNADSDGDGLADGAEGALGTNPALADSSTPPNGVNDGVELANNAGLVGSSLPPRSLLATTPATSGVQISADGLSVTFGGQLNQDCVNRTGAFTGPLYDPANSSVPGNERCAKRAVRANVGVAPGEFRYFETRRFSGPTQGELANIGQGIITPSAQVDPYCCYFLQTDLDYATYVNAGSPETPKAANPTPSSMTINSIGGVFSRLILVNPAGFATPLDLAQTQFYGFAVDYRNTDPRVYVIGLNASGNMVVSDAVDPGPFSNAAAMPMLHGHPTTGTGPHSGMNLGASKFHYTLADVKTALTAKGVTNADAMVGGVGIHRW